MNNNSITLLENFCRTCMNGGHEDNKETESRKRNSISVFSELESLECNNITIMELLMLTVPQLSIDSGDMLPKTVCKSCLEQLINAYKFQKMCVRVEQKLREMVKEIPVESQKSKDPLKDISIDNVNVLQSVNDLTHIFKIEMDEPLIDQNETSSNKNMIEDTEDVKFETEDNQWEEITDSEDSDDDDIDSEWEIPCNNTKSKIGPKTVKRIKDDTVKEEEQTSEIISDSKTNSRIAIKNDVSKNFECDECGNRLSTRKSLKRHKRIHLRTMGVSQINTLDKAKDTGNKIFECDECGNRLSTRKSLKRHKRIHQRPVVAGQRNTLVKIKHECEFCKKVFQQSSSLKDHLRKHTGEQPYLCSECGKAFKSLSNMKQHFLRHGTERPYVCPDCPKRFPCLSDLASHKAVHNKIKSHVCDICGAAFVKPYLLKKHNMYHTGEKNHKCDYCDMRFVVADHCRRHMRTHTGEKPYKCKYCERAFAQSNDLTKHLRGHLGDNVYKCDLCPQGFRLQGDLRAHFYTHKNDDDETRARNLQALKDEENRLQIKFGLIKLQAYTEKKFEI